MKKLLCVLLCVTLALPLGIFAFAADTPDAADAGDGDDTPAVEVETDLGSAFAEGENSLIVFVTGIGQSFSYLFDESYVEEGAFENGTLQDFENYAPLIAERKYSSRWNLFVGDFDEALSRPVTKKTIAKVVFQLLGTLFLRHNIVKEEDLRTLVQNLFNFNQLDENGNLSERLVTPRYACPVSQYPGVIDEEGNFDSESKGRFYGSIPCADIAREKLGDNYEDYLYCFNYSPFSLPTRNVSELHEYIETVLANNTVGAEKVVLVPMSMGASVVSAYLADYPDVEDNHVRRVVSIVGCWNGSDIITDLVTETYADNSADLFYNGLISDIIGEPWGYAVNLAVRLFSKRALRSFIDEALAVFADELVLRDPAIIAAITPDYAYETVRPYITRDWVLEQTDYYHALQSTLRERLAALEAQGVTFSFISGYGLPFGAETNDYKAFGFMHSAPTTNSDEIINISSTAPGTQYVAYNETFADTEGRELSPDGSIDISGTYYKDSSWFFYRQKHELEHNNTAIKLAISLALGTVKTVDDCSDPAGENYFPQFNDARYVRFLKNDYIPKLEKYLAAGGTLTPEQQALYEDAKAMLARTVNNYDEDNKLIESFVVMLIDLGLEDPPETPDKKQVFLNNFLKKSDGVANKIYGSKGYLDFFQ
ncbi:MAG: alpha/beta hydrolase [Clostridia bacterium]|nr:alpha/beta hydrolase [Clostridia bacterium]